MPALVILTAIGMLCLHQACQSTSAPMSMDGMSPCTIGSRISVIGVWIVDRGVEGR
jgi:hypothetical protein